MDKWIEGNENDFKGSNNWNSVIIGVFAISAICTIYYLYTCTCIFGASICHEQGKTHDKNHPFMNEVSFSFLEEPGMVVYPWASMKLKEEGSTDIDLTINSNGEIISYQIVESSGYEYLDQAALNSIPSLSINKSEINGISVVKRVKYTFKMPENDVTNNSSGTPQAVPLN